MELGFENILVIRYGTIGDTVWSTAFYRELRRACPNAKIDALVDNISKAVLEGCPYIDELVPLLGGYELFNSIKYISLFKKYDTIFFLKNDKKFTTLASLARVKNRIGFDVRRNKNLTVKVPYKSDKHERDFYLDLLKVFGINPVETHTELWLKDENINSAKQYFNKNATKHVVLQCYSRLKEKNWINRYWAEVITHLSNELECQVYYLGGKKEVGKYKKIEKLLSKDLKIKPINLCGQMSIQKSIAFVKQADLLIGIDSGLLHVAANFDVPSILLNGPTSITHWRPLSEQCSILSMNFSCSPCMLESSRKKFCQFRTSKCMFALKPEKVTCEIKKKL